MASRTVLTKNANLPIIFARSGIFGQVQSFPPRAFNHAQVALFGTQKVIYFSGIGLEEQDRDVFMCLLALSRQRPLGEAVSISFYRLQQMVKGILGIAQVHGFDDWLKASILRLTHCKVSIEEGVTEEPILKIEQRRDVVECQFNPHFAELLMDSVSVDLGVRRQLKNRLAKTLHVLLSSDPAKVVCLPFEWLISALGYDLSTEGFKEQLTTACEVLQRQGYIASYEWVQRCQSQGVLKIIRHQFVEPYKPEVAYFGESKKVGVRGTLTFTESGSNSFYPNAIPSQLTVKAADSMLDGEDLLQIRGELFAPFIPHNACIALTRKEKVKEHDLVLVTTKTSYYLGYVMFKQMPNLLLTFPGRSDTLIHEDTIQRIEKIRGVLYT